MYTTTYQCLIFNFSGLQNERERHLNFTYPLFKLNGSTTAGPSCPDLCETKIMGSFDLGLLIYTPVLTSSA